MLKGAAADVSLTMTIGGASGTSTVQYVGTIIELGIEVMTILVLMIVV